MKKNYIYIALLLAFISLFLDSCKVALLPNYDASILAQIETTSKQVDRFYLMMIETSKEKDNGRSYELFAVDYVTIEVELNSLLLKNKIRPLNENSTRICEITLELWQKYKEEHKMKNSLSDGMIKLNRQSFNDLFYAMQVAENGKNMVNNPPKY